MLDRKVETTVTRSPNEFMCIGHRGSPVHEAENTLSSFERALDEGANGLEVDLAFTKDQEVVLWHDASPHGVEARAREFGLEPYVGFRPVPPQSGRYRKRIGELFADDVLARFGYARKRDRGGRIESLRIATFDELLRLLVARGPLTALFLDVKLERDEIARLPEFVGCIERLLARRAPAVRHVVYETEDRSMLEAIADAAPGRARTLDVGPLYGVHPFPNRHSAVRSAIRHKNAFATAKRPRKSVVFPWQTYRRSAHFDVELRDLHNARALARERIEGLVGFTVNVRSEMRTLVELGFDGLLTDDLRGLAEVVEECLPSLAPNVDPARATAPQVDRQGQYASSSNGFGRQWSSPIQRFKTSA